LGGEKKKKKKKEEENLRQHNDKEEDEKGGRAGARGRNRDERRGTSNPWQEEKKVILPAEGMHGNRRKIRNRKKEKGVAAKVKEGGGY